MTAFASTSVILCDKNGVADVDDACLAMFEYSREEIIDKNVLQLIAEEDRPRVEKYLRQDSDEALATQGLKKSGAKFPVEIIVKKTLHQGQELEILVIQNRTNEADVATRFVDLSIDLLCVADFDGYFKRLSPAFKEALGYDDEELLAKPFLEFVHPEDRGATQKQIESLSAGSDVIAFENRFQTTSGSFKWLAWNATAFMDVGLIYAIGRDISLQKENLLELQKREEQLRSILETTVDGIITINAAGIVQSFNPAASKIFGYKQEEVIGQNVRMLMPEPYHSEHDDYLRAYMTTRKRKIIGIGREVKGVKKNGETFPLELAVSNVELPNRTLFTGIVRDITEKKEAEESLRSAQERLQKELDVAAHIQDTLTPKTLPVLDGFEFAAKNIPARYLSGDFYDFISIDENTYEIVLGDIAGKGIPAALLTLSLHTLIRYQSSPFPFVISAPEILDQINIQRYEDFSNIGVFVTLFLAQINKETGAFSYASAGHGEAFLYRARNEIQHLAATGLPIGILADERYEGKTFILRPDDVVVIFTDGITETTGANQEQFGVERLNATVIKSASLSADDILYNIIADVLEFDQGHAQEDDISIVVMKVLPRMISFHAPSEMKNLETIIAKIKENALAYSEDFAYEFELAASEIITNVIKYSDKQEQADTFFEINLRPDGLQVDIFSQGEPFDLSQFPEPNFDEIKESGYGISIARQVLDELTCQPNALGGSHWRLVKLYNGE